MYKFILFLFLATSLFPQQLTTSLQEGEAEHSYFIENKGQWPEEVRYLTKIGGLNAWITDQGVVYDFYKVERKFTPEELSALPVEEQDRFRRENTQFQNQVIRVNYVNSLSGAGDERLDKKSGHHNYYLGKDRTKWAEFVELFGEVRLNELYEGIDIRYYFDNGLLRYDYKAAPNADISQIQLEVEGADEINVNAEGELVMQTQFGEVIHGKLLAYQNEWYGLRPVECGFIKNDDGTVRVNTAEYDRNKALTIDPVVFSTYIGGSDFDFVTGVDITSAGDYVLTGDTYSSNYPITAGTYNGDLDMFITQIDSTTKTLDFSTYYGSSAEEFGNTIIIGTDGSTSNEMIYALGDVSIPPNLSFDNTIAGTSQGVRGTVILYLDINTGTLQSSLLIDGGNSDWSGDLVHDDAAGILYVTGITSSNDFTSFSGALGGLSDVYVVSINDFDHSQFAGLYLGGSDNEFSPAIDLRNSTGNLYISGKTSSTDFPNTAGGVQGSNGGSTDIFVAILDQGDPTTPTAPSVSSATYYGGASFEENGGIAVNQTTGDVFAAGQTSSIDFPTVNPIQGSNAGYEDGFLIKLNNDLSSCDFATYFGGSSDEYPNALGLNEGTKPVVIGFTGSADFPVTSGAEYSTNQGENDIFVIEFAPDGSRIDYGTYFGGTFSEYGYDAEIIGTNHLIFGGENYDDYPLVNPYQGTFGGGSIDGVFTELRITESPGITVTAPDGGEVWADGSSHDILWNSTGVSNVDVDYSTDGGSNWSNITSNIPATSGSYSWIIPDLLSFNCLVRVSDASDPTVNDISNANFTIYNVLIALISPNGGEVWEAGTPKAITWFAEAGISNVKLEYTTDGSNWNTIVNSIDATLGSYNWTVPNTPSTTCLVRVSDASDALVNDASDNDFTIFTSSITVDAPNGGETFRAGGTETISWTAVGIDNVKIEYSLNDGTDWTVVDPSVAGSLGTYDWEVPNVSSTEALIRLSDELNPSISDESDAVFEIGDPTALISYDAGWNLLSVPWTLDDPLASNVFTDKASDVFAYSFGYYVIYNLQPENGFWIKMSGPGSEEVYGQGYSDSVINVFTGWNIIGALEYDVSTAGIAESTPGMVVSDYYEYSGGYSPVSTLVTGKGYWVKVSQNGTLTLPTGPPKVEPIFTPEEDWLTVTVSDAAGNSQQLYIADAEGNFELPPLPPNEIFDARFGNDTYISSEAAANQLRFQSEDYPLTISVSGGNLKLTDGATGTIINRQLLDGESLTITNKNIGNLNIHTVEIPLDYILYQNYPNPFNPATTIKFGLPQAGKVEITIYDQLGQKVETLINKEIDAGYHEIEWNAMQYSSGVYFYTINSGNFKAVKKMLLLK